jgi:hypothetical protein
MVLLEMTPVAKSIFVHFSAACARLAAGQNIC